MLKTFKHSGDLGDIIYSLPTIQLLGGGVLYLDVTGGETEEVCKQQCIDGKTKFNKVGFDFLYPLLSQQQYISEVKIWNGEKIDYNLNKFRLQFANPNSRSKTKNLLDLHLEAFGLPEHDKDEGWLDCGDPILNDRKVVVSRSPRMQANYPWFQSNKFLFRDQGVFVGLPKEHEYFEWTLGITIPYHPVKDALELCKVVKGADLFIGNSSFPLALAIGLGTVKIVQELEPHFPTTYFEGRKTMQYV